MSQSGEPFDPYYQWLGIPPDEQPANHYRLLGIQLFEDNREVIQNAADRQMVHLRTYQSGPRAAASQRLLNEVAAAKLCLLSLAKKATYDEQLRISAVSPAPLAKSPTGPTPPPKPELGSLFRQTKRRAAPAKRVRASRAARRTGPRLARGPMVFLMLVVAGGVFATIYFGGDRIPTNRLVLTWPEAEREGARLEIDERVRDMIRDPAERRPGAVEFALEPGPHSLRITRPGYQTLERSFVLEPGTRVEIAATFTQDATAANLIVRWPASERSGAIFEIDGRLCDMETQPLGMNAFEVRFRLDRGEHKIRIVRDGEVVLDRTFTLDGKRRVTLAPAATNLSTAQLALKWREAQRSGAKLEIDGETYALRPDPADNSADRLLYTLRPGKHALRITMGDAPPLSRSVTVVAGERLELDVGQLLSRLPARLTLVWPAADREGATVEIDGEALDLTTASAGSNEDQIAFEIKAGEHTLRIVRPGHEMFEERLDNVFGDVRVTVTSVPLPPSRPLPAELASLRKDFQAAYREYDEFRKWNEELDPARKRQLRRFLVARLAAEAEKRPDDSPQQFVAFDESIRLAIESSEFVLAVQIVNNAIQKEIYGEQEGQMLRERIWNEVLVSPQFDSLVEYLMAQKAEGGAPNEQEQSRFVERLKSLPQLETDYLTVERSTRELCEEGVLTDAAAVNARVAVYEQAGKGRFATPGEILDLGVRILAFVPTLFASNSQRSAQPAESLLDVVASLRRKALADVRATVEHRTQAGKLNEEAKRVRDLAAQFDRVLDARKEVAAGTGTSAHHKLLGFWKLQLGSFEEAWTHLRKTDDEALAQISRPRPATATELAELADEVEREAKKKTKYTKRQEESLRAYAQHVRRLALDKHDGSLSPPEQQKLRGKLEDRASLNRNDRRFPKGKWVNLSDLVTVDELRERVKESAVGSWTVLDDGTIVVANRKVSKLELPINVELSYGLQFVCQRTEGHDVNVNLPLGESSVLLALGTYPRQASGIHLLNGKKAGEPGNPSTINRADFAFRKDVHVAVEIQVEVLKAESQSAKQRKRTGGQNWATISVKINNRPLPSVSAPLSRFSVPENFALSRNVLGFSSRARVAYGGIRLMRK